MLAGAGFVLALLWSLAWNVVAYVQDPPVPTVEHEFHLKPKENISWSFEGVGGKYDNRQLQRGFQVYKEVCSACHSLKQVAFRDLEEIGFNKAEVKAIAKNWVVEVPSINPETGEPATRKAMPFDKFPSPYANETMARASNNNALPPDQSLLAKAREGGPHYLYSLLTGYQDQPAELLKKFPDAKTPDGLHYNPYFPNLNLAMAPPLADGQVTYADGTPNTQKQMAKDVSAFLMWAAEPNLPTRHAVGWATLAYLLVLTGLAYLAYRSIWADKKPKKAK
ncbi:cytochrome c1 [Sphingomonas sp. SUN039]|nr:cytochrome c1 [Sphingomonas sp. SUN039]UVO55864.1 cytochrome c1 [Sphingomonas sp. SUN039]